MLETGCHELDLELATRTSPTLTDHATFKEYSPLVRKLVPLSEKMALVQLVSSLNSVLGDLIIKFPNAESHPLVQALKEETRWAGLRLEEVVQHSYMYRLHMYTNVFQCQEREIITVETE